MLKLWNIRDALFSSTDIINAPQMFPLVAVFESSFGARIMCLDASPGEEVMILKPVRFQLKTKSEILIDRILCVNIMHY